jgi:hypothetical protein
MEAEVGLGLGGRAGPVHLRHPPRLGVLLEERPCPRRVDADATGQVPPDAVEEVLGVPLAGELAGLLGPSGVLPPTGPVGPVRPFIDACHGLPKSRTNEWRKSSISPQVLNQSSAQRAPTVCFGHSQSPTVT